MKNNIIEMRNISKSFGGIYVLRDINFSVKKSSIMGLVGENGAGKSTLIKILTGVYKKDEGKMIVDGREVNLGSFSQSRSLGIALLPQELGFIPNFSVAENIFLGWEPRLLKSTFVNWKSLYSKTKDILEKYKIDVNPKSMVKKLSVSQQQMVEVARILSQNAKIIVFDEPTTRLGSKEVEELLDYILYLKSTGVSIIYISHELSEIFKICDEITILRDGKLVGKDETKNFTQEKLIKLMVDRKIVKTGPVEKKKKEFGKEVLRVENLSSSKVKNVSFKVRSGEILGLSGLVGAGRTEIIRAMLGIDKRKNGKIFIDNKEVKIKNIRNAIRAGFAYVPEERRKQGLVLPLSIRENFSLGNLKAYSFLKLFINQKRETRAAKKAVKLLRLNTENVNMKVGNLSGGNQQKVVLSKWITHDIKVLILDEPTRGIDVGAKAEIYKLIKEVAGKGIAILVVSSEIPEIQEVCDRALVIKLGRIEADLDYGELHAEKIIKHAIGL